MKSVHYYIYGLLTGSVLILSTILMVKSFNDVEAQAATSTSSEVAMATGQYQGQESILYMVMKNPRNGEPVLLTYAAPNFQLSLIAARNLKYDRRVIDRSFGRPQQTSGNSTYPPVEAMRPNQGGGDGGGAGAGGNQR